MSWPVMALCALSTHPALRESHRNRALLLRLANKADDSGGGIRYSVATMADLMAGGAPSTGDAFADLKTRDARIRKTREALAELHAAGLCEPTGETYGPKGQEVIVRRILIAALALYTDPIEAGRWLTEEKFPGLAFMAAPLPVEGIPCRLAAPLPVGGTGASVGQDTPAVKGQDTPAAEWQGTPAVKGQPILSSTVHETEPQTEKRASARSESAPILGHEVEALNAATALRNQAALGRRGGAIPTRRPAPVEAAPVEALHHEAKPLTPEAEAEARVAAAVERLIPEFAAYYLETSKLKHAARIEAAWRRDLRIRLLDDGPEAAYVQARVDGILSILRWWRLPLKGTVPVGVPSCWADAPRRTLPFILKGTGKSPAENLDRAIVWASEPHAPPPKQWASRQARPWAAVGGAQLQPPMPDPVADAEHAERMAALERVEREHLEELERQAAAESRARDAAKPKMAPPSAPPKTPTETGRGAFARMGETLMLNGLAIGQRAR